MSGSRCCSRKAENSTRRSFWVAMALPSQGGGGAGGEALPEGVEQATGAAVDEERSAISDPVPLDEDPLPVLLLADGLAPTA